MPASLARALPRRARGRVSSERDRLADFSAHNTLLYFVNRAAGGEGWVGRKRRGPCTGGLAKRVPVWGGTTYNSCCAPRNGARRSHRRAGTSTVGVDVPSCHPPNGAKSNQRVAVSFICWNSIREAGESTSINCWRGLSPPASIRGTKRSEEASQRSGSLAAS